MIMVGRGVGVAPIGNCPARMSETVPNRLATAVCFDGPLDLIGRGRRPPHEATRKRGGSPAVGLACTGLVNLTGYGRRGRYCKNRPAGDRSELAARKSVGCHLFTSLRWTNMKHALLRASLDADQS